MKSSNSRCSLLVACAFSLLASCAAVFGDSGEDYFPITQNGKLGFIDKAGKIVISPQFDSGVREEGRSFSEGLTAVQVGDKWGYIDKTGKFIIQPKFKQTSPPSLFHEGLAQVETEDGTSGVIDKSGEFVEALKSIQGISMFSEGLAVARKGERAGYVDKTGKLVIEARFAEADLFKEGLAAVKLEDTPEAKYGFVDKTGKMVIEPQFSQAESFSGGFAAIQLEGKHGYINKSGKVVIALQFDEASSFSDGLARVGIGDKTGFIDTTGKMVISPRFDSPVFGSSLEYREFKEGLAAVKGNKKSGYINKTGKMIIDLQHDYGFDFSGGLARVISGSDPKTQKAYYIDKTGKIIWEPKPN